MAAGADVPGASLVTAALMLGVYTIVGPAAEEGWGAARTLLLGAGALVLLAGFVARQATAAKPLMPLRVFASRNLVGANAVQILGVAGMFGMFFLGALYLQRVLGYDALETGLAFLPVTVVMGTLSVRYTERLVVRFGARRLQLPGLAGRPSAQGLVEGYTLAFWVAAALALAAIAVAVLVLEPEAQAAPPPVEAGASEAEPAYV